MALVGANLTSLVIKLTPIFPKILTSCPYNCWPLLMRMSVYLFCLILILEERLMRLPFLNHEMLVACLPMSPLWRPLGPRPRDRRSRPPGRLFTRHRSFTRPSLEGKLSPLWREDRSLNFIDASPPVKGFNLHYMFHLSLQNSHK